LEAGQTETLVQKVHKLIIFCRGCAMKSSIGFFWIEVLNNIQQKTQTIKKNK